MITLYHECTLFEFGHKLKVGKHSAGMRYEDRLANILQFGSIIDHYSNMPTIVQLLGFDYVALIDLSHEQ